jgi:hypothetical protein
MDYVRRHLLKELHVRLGHAFDLYARHPRTLLEQRGEGDAGGEK